MVGQRLGRATLRQEKQRVPSEDYALDKVFQYGPCSSISTLKATMYMCNVSQNKTLGCNLQRNTEKFPLGTWLRLHVLRYSEVFFFHHEQPQKLMKRVRKFAQIALLPWEFTSKSTTFRQTTISPLLRMRAFTNQILLDLNPLLKFAWSHHRRDKIQSFSEKLQTLKKKDTSYFLILS